MIAFNIVFGLIVAGVASWLSGLATDEDRWRIAVLHVLPFAFWLNAGWLLIKKRGKKDRPVLRLGRFTWSLGDFCRGWFITGVTGSGKTLGAVKRMLWQVSTHYPGWGGLCLDEKGLFWETLTEMFHRHPRKQVTDLILLEVRPDNAPADWKPLYTFNFLDVPGIPYSNHAKTIVDVATSLQKKGSRIRFFRNKPPFISNGDSGH